MVTVYFLLVHSVLHGVQVPRHYPYALYHVLRVRKDGGEILLVLYRPFLLLQLFVLTSLWKLKRGSVCSLNA